MKIVWSVLVRLDSFKISCRFCVILWFCFCRFCDRRGSFPPVIWRSKGCRISEFLSPRLQVLHTHSTTHCPLCNGTGNRKRDENLAHLHQHHYNEIKQDKYTTKIIHPSKINYYFFYALKHYPYYKYLLSYILWVVEAVLMNTVLFQSCYLVTDYKDTLKKCEQDPENYRATVYLNNFNLPQGATMYVI